MDANKTHWRIGELVESTGLTARTLHHYDEIGLLVPAERTGGGHRLYADQEVRRLYRIVSLRQLGFRLGEIASLLASDDADPRAAVPVISMPSTKGSGSPRSYETDSPAFSMCWIRPTSRRLNS